MYQLFRQKTVWSLLLGLSFGWLPLQAQTDNRFEVSKNLDIFNALVKEMEMFYVDSVDVEKSVRRGIDAMLDGLDPYTEYIPEQEMETLKMMTTGEYGGIGSYIRQRNTNGGVMIAEPNEWMQAAYIYLKGFTDKSAQEVKEAFLDLKKNHQIESLILDLRNNGGGVLEGAVQIVGMFVPKGSEVISTKGKIKQWDRTYRTPVEPIDTTMPMAVLINGNSASASEIVSGSLQDLDRAILVGQRSFGKGLVQSTRDLPDDG